MWRLVKPKEGNRHHLAAGRADLGVLSVTRGDFVNHHQFQGQGPPFRHVMAQDLADVLLHQQDQRMAGGERNISQYAGDFLPMGEPLLTDAEFNSGISVALPVSQIIEVLYQKALCDARNATLERLKQESGFRPTS